MELQFQNNRQDFIAYFSVFPGFSKKAGREQFYRSVVWYLAILTIAAALAFNHDEFFIFCIFAVLAIFYIKDNWSYERSWMASAQAYADQNIEGGVTLVLDQAGMTEHFFGTQLQVPWSTIMDYRVAQERVFIRYLKNRAFIVPLAQLSNAQRDQLFGLLEQHKIAKSDAT